MAPKTNTAKTETETTAPAQVDVIAQYKAKLPELKAIHKTTSGVIRALAAEGLKRGQIAKITDKLYQHVRNVLITPVNNKTPSNQ